MLVSYEPVCKALYFMGALIFIAFLMLQPTFSMHKGSAHFFMRFRLPMRVRPGRGAAIGTA
jgi:hypothetical protein